MRCFFLLIRNHIVAILTIIPIGITGSEVKPVQFSRGPSSPAGNGDEIAHVAFITFTVIITPAPWHPEMKFVIHAIVVYWDVSVSASDLRLLKHHLRGQIIKKYTIVNTHCLHTNHHGRRWVLRMLDLTLEGSKSVVIHPLLVALR
jgi:hypothetical protein